MSPFMLILRHRETIADHTMAFHFGKPAHFQFIAGQALNLTLVTPPETDAEGDTRTFTIASAPEDDEIVIATRLRDTAFKRVLASVPIGTHVQAEGPDGSFTLQPDASVPAVFLTGGIGITPFRSIIRNAVARNSPTPIWLFYSNNRPEDAAFLDELQGLADVAPSLHFVRHDGYGEVSPRLAGRDESYRSRDDSSPSAKYSGPRYYLAGPPTMVMAMRKMLTAAEVSDADIQFEEFSRVLTPWRKRRGRDRHACGLIRSLFKNRPVFSSHDALRCL